MKNHQILSEFLGERLCNKCKITKPLSEFSESQLKIGHFWCKPCRVEHTEGYRDKNPEKYRKYRLESYRKRRIAVLSYYSNGNIKCECCSESVYEFLSLDHVDGGGTQHRKEVPRGSGFYQWIINNNFPPGFRVLCHNCNQAIGHYGKCPHKNLS